MGAPGAFLESGFAPEHHSGGDPFVSRSLTPQILMDKAKRACASARALLDLDDVDGACNRAYYAMFDAARAALLATNAPVRACE